MKNRSELLKEYLKANVVPVLVDYVFGEDLYDAVVIPADIKKEELTGHYEGENYLPPKWYSACADTVEGDILIIDRIDTIPKEEQLKFVELLEYRKVSTFELPSNTVVMVTANKISKDTIHEEILSLVAIV
ncbi:MAG: hypothetical protein IKN87_05130 [Bacilli bacterium]|nr:hypothetical protein [Bacilli bacterium]